jgi:hypothetical protein
MNVNHADRMPFRAWLVNRLKTTRWTIASSESAEDVSLLLGVTRDVLEQATRERASEQKLPRRPRRGSLAQHAYSPLAVVMPPAVHRDWMAFCSALHVSSSALLRSLIHHLLVTKKRPTTTAPSWLYRGKVHRIKPTGRLHAKTRVTRGVQVALDRYADLWCVKPTAILRGLITDMLLARRPPEGLQVVAFSELWNDPARYLRGAP